MIDNSLHFLSHPFNRPASLFFAGIKAQLDDYMWEFEKPNILPNVRNHKKSGQGSLCIGFQVVSSDLLFGCKIISVRPEQHFKNNEIKEQYMTVKERHIKLYHMQ